MAFLPVPDTALVRLVGHLNGQEIINTQYRRLVGGWAPSSLGSLAIDYLGWVGGFFAGLLHNTYHFDFVQCVDLAVDGGAEVTIPPSGPISGTKGGNGLPNNVSYCVSFRSGLSGRSNRGRNYIAAISDADLNGPNNVSALYRSSVVAAYEQLLPGGIIPVGEWVVVSRFHNNLPRSEGATVPITSVLTVDDILDSQRRRLPGRGV